jgi:hypothetical protein
MGHIDTDYFSFPSVFFEVLLLAPARLIDFFTTFALENKLNLT